MKIAKSVLGCVALFLAIVLPTVNCQEQVPDEKAVLARAAKSQTDGGYEADKWKLVTLNPGDVVYGGIPGQSAFYTTKATLDASELQVVKLFQSLQVKPHPTFGYRTQMQEYTVQKKVTVPFGKVAANPKLGPGGGEQYFIDDFKNLLKPGRIIDLKK